jgi:Growth-Arrest-Specific Protein 2 Domain
VQLPITRLGKGFYMFGTKKIFAKILNSKLVVRVGGGFMGIDEFINTYGESELLKMKRMSMQHLA